MRRKKPQALDFSTKSLGLRLFPKLEHMGFEPTASTMRMLRAPNCANAPHQSMSIISL